MPQTGPADTAHPPQRPTPPVVSSSLVFPVTSKDDINTIAHYYRGEMARMTSWRDRIDRTTNWAIGAVAAMLSVSLASPAAHHGVLLFAMVLVFLLLYIESRRYRFFHLFRGRVRLLERNYYAAFFDARAASPTPDWAGELSASLREPTFTITRRQAMARRLKRNYIWIFTILFTAWLLKTTTVALLPRAGRAEFVHSLDEFFYNATVASIPGSVVLLAVLAFHAWLLYVMVRHRKVEGEVGRGEAHV